MEFTAENRLKLDRIVARYPVKRSALLPALHLVQSQEGWISEQAMEYLAGLLGLTAAQVHDTATFYTMFRFKPEGARHLEVCTNLSCALTGSEDLVQVACRKLGVKEGETSADGKWTVNRVECLAACGGGPALQVDGQWLEKASLDDLDGILSGAIGSRPFDWPRSPGEPILLANVFKPGFASLATYRDAGGYANLKKYLETNPDEIVTSAT